MRVLVLGDLHLPWVCWPAVRAITRFCESYKPDVIVQVGDFIDAHAWSRFAKGPDAPNADTEWQMAEAAARKLHSALPRDVRMWIVEGNHDRRIQTRALEAQVPSRLLKPLRDLFPYENWHWWIKPQPLELDGVAYIHGDEAPGTPIAKARAASKPVVHGHLHRDAGIHYGDLFTRQLWGMNVGTLMDTSSIAAKYANRNIQRSWIGWATVTDGLPALYPWRLMRLPKFNDVGK